MAAVVYLADTSTYVLRERFALVRTRTDPLLLAGTLAACQMTALEMLNNAPGPRQYEELWAVLHSQRWLDVDARAVNRAMDVHRTLAGRSQHRYFALPDLIIAATAELNGATVLHYDQDYDRIAEVTGQPVEWVVPRGSL
ncbi:MAG: PIN domain nuclease [Pseudonocardia sp.]|nr:PIN domain nuclease [Pseudonocardia sp.]